MAEGLQILDLVQHASICKRSVLLCTPDARDPDWKLFHCFGINICIRDIEKPAVQAGEANIPRNTRADWSVLRKGHNTTASF